MISIVTPIKNNQWFKNILFSYRKYLNQIISQQTAMMKLRTFAKFSIIFCAIMIGLADIGVLIFSCLTFYHWFSYLYAAIVYFSRQAFQIGFFCTMDYREYDICLCFGLSVWISISVVISSLLTSSMVLFYLQIMVGCLILFLITAVWLYSRTLNEEEFFNGQVMFQANNVNGATILVLPGRAGDNPMIQMV